MDAIRNHANPRSESTRCSHPLRHTVATVYWRSADEPECYATRSSTRMVLHDERNGVHSERSNSGSCAHAAAAQTRRTSASSIRWCDFPVDLQQGSFWRPSCSTSTSTSTCGSSSLLVLAAYIERFISILLRWRSVGAGSNIQLICLLRRCTKQVYQRIRRGMGNDSG